MNLLMQFAIILGISFAGEGLSALLPLPIPASVYGLCLMLLLLCTGVLKPKQISGAARYLIEVMPIMFVPAFVGLMEHFDRLMPVFVPFVLICLISTVLVMGVTGRVTQRILRKGGKPHA